MFRPRIYRTKGLTDNVFYQGVAYLHCAAAKNFRRAVIFAELARDAQGRQCRQILPVRGVRWGCGRAGGGVLSCKEIWARESRYHRACGGKQLAEMGFKHLSPFCSFIIAHKLVCCVLPLLYLVIASLKSWYDLVHIERYFPPPPPNNLSGYSEILEPSKEASKNNVVKLVEGCSLYDVSEHMHATISLEQ